MTRTALIASLVAIVAVAGCGGSSGRHTHNKSGSSVARTQVLDLQATDSGSPEARYLAKRVSARSGGSLSVRLRDDYSSATPANEARLARDLRAGRAGFGLLRARAWARAGVRAFDALSAPFVLGTYDVARAAVAGPAGRDLKGALARAGMVPLELVPAELRRLLSVRPLRGPAAFAGLRIRIPDNATAAAVLRGLGAEPVQGMTASRTQDELRSSQLGGMETAPIWAIPNGYGQSAPYVTAFALYDRVDTLVAAPRVWRRLSAEQQSAVGAAARDTVGFAATLADRDDRDLSQLCREGARVTAIGEAQLAIIARATEPVRRALRRDPVIGPVLATLEATPGAGPRLLPIPSGCARPTAPATSTGDAIPNGTYQVRTTVADFQRAGLSGRDWAKPILWTIRLAHGRFHFSQHPDYPDAGPGSGTFTVTGDTARFRILKPAVDANPPWTARWSYYQGVLTWVPIDIADPGQRTVWGAHPWRKVR
jgi:TRAP-type C4-dicarboxylate transport system substrate-binding protein